MTKPKRELSISTGSFYPEPTSQTIRRIHDLGFKAVEVMIQDSELNYDFHRHVDLKLFRELGKIVEDHGLSVGSLHAPLLSSGQAFSTRVRREILASSLEAASMLGGNTLIIHPHHLFLSYEDACKFLSSSDLGIQDLVLPGFPSFLAKAEGYGIRVALENIAYWHDFPLLNDAGMMERVLEGLGKTNVLVDLDILHSELGGSTSEFLSRLRESIVSLHIADYGDGQSRTLPGKGKIDWRKIIHTAQELPKLEHIVMELAGKLENSEIKKSANYLQGLLES